eukprot:SAG22_NODE_2699_length_2303_cov_1.417423_1_plen_513_part_10
MDSKPLLLAHPRVPAAPRASDGASGQASGASGGEPARVSRASQKQIRRAKRRVRSELRLKEWDKYKYKRQLRLPPALENIETVHCRRLPTDQFIARFEAAQLPCLIEGLCDAVAELWQPERLCSEFEQCKFKVGADDRGRPVRLRLKHFAQYLRTDAASDDSPLYLFDPHFGARAPALLGRYCIPAYFSQDLFRLAGSNRRPPHRWLIFGSARTGSSMHIDPLGTSAWNMLMAGRKRWLLFPPGTPKELVTLPRYLKPRGGGGSEAVAWFDKMLPRLRGATNFHPVGQQPAHGYRAFQWKGGGGGGGGGGGNVSYEFYDVVQYPGQTIFVPGGWWHIVLNLDTTVAVTQNFCSAQNFDRVWPETAKGRPRLAGRWLVALEEAGHVELAHKALAYMQGELGLPVKETVPLGPPEARRRALQLLLLRHRVGRRNWRRSTAGQLVAAVGRHLPLPCIPALKAAADESTSDSSSDSSPSEGEEEAAANNSNTSSDSSESDDGSEPGTPEAAAVQIDG